MADDDIGQVQLHISSGTDLDARDETLQTPLRYAALRGHRSVAELLIANGADVNAEDNEGSTPLHRATEKHHTDVAELLLAKGADVNAKTTDREETPLIWAAYYGYNDAAELLINKGADINIKDQLGRTPMAVAKEKGRDEVLELLCKHGAKE